MLRISVFVCAVVAMAHPLPAQEVDARPANPQIDFAGHLALATEVQSYREDRLLPLSEFQAFATRNDVILLDARSAEAFSQGHIDGAINLPLPDFTADRLGEVIGTDTDRPILIYCNNNFSNNAAPVVRKIITVALNIQTMVNLYGYGYRNIYELADVVDFNDPTVRWVGTMASAN